MEDALQYGQHQLLQSGPAPKPSIFDVQAQESTKDLLYALLEGGLLRWSSRNGGGEQAERAFSPTVIPFLPRALQWIRRWGSPLTRYFDEVYLALDLLVEIPFMWATDASLCENYYEMVRQGAGKGGRLTSMQRLVSIIEVVQLRPEMGGGPSQGADHRHIM